MANCDLSDVTYGHELGLAYLTDIAGGGGITQIVAGDGIVVDNTNPLQPEVSCNGVTYTSTSSAPMATSVINVSVNPPNPQNPPVIKVLESHWLKADPNPLLDQDKYFAITQGDGYVQLDSVWSGHGQESVVVNAYPTINVGNNAGGGIVIANTQNAGGGSAVLYPFTDSELYVRNNANNRISRLTPNVWSQYIAVSSSVTQPSRGIGIPTPLEYDTVEAVSTESNGSPNLLWGGVGNPSYITNNAVSGVFRVMPSIQLNTTNNTPALTTIYLQINGNPVPRSSYTVTVDKNADILVTCENIVTLNQNDYLEVVMNSLDPDVKAVFVAGTPPIPDCPSIITNITRIG